MTSTVAPSGWVLGSGTSRTRTLRVQEWVGVRSLSVVSLTGAGHILAQVLRYFGSLDQGAAGASAARLCAIRKCLEGGGVLAAPHRDDASGFLKSMGLLGSATLAQAERRMLS